MSEEQTPSGVGDGEEAVPSVEVENHDGAAALAEPVHLGPPDHLIRHETYEAAYAAMVARNPRYETFGEALQAFDERRADNSRRLEAWLAGGSE